MSNPLNEDRFPDIEDPARKKLAHVRAKIGFTLPYLEAARNSSKGTRGEMLQYCIDRLQEGYRLLLEVDESLIDVE